MNWFAILKALIFMSAGCLTVLILFLLVYSDLVIKQYTTDGVDLLFLFNSAAITLVALYSYVIVSFFTEPVATANAKKKVKELQRISSSL